MKRLFLCAAILLSAFTCIQAQIDFRINADSVLITNDGSPAELIIENSTKNIKGLLVNKGNGQTEFRRVQKLNDSTFIFGTDTFLIKGSGGKSLQQVTDAGNTTIHYINANGGYYQKETLLLHATDSILKAGFRAGQSNTLGNGNTAIGYEALQKNLTGSGNAAMGHQALQLDSSDYNVGIGYSALAQNTTGTGNIGIGAQAMYDNTTGSYNVGIGTQAGPSTPTASYAVAIGVTTRASGNDVFIGANSNVYKYAGLNNTVVGNYAMNQSNGNRNTVMGASALSSSGQNDNTVIGAYTLDMSDGYNQFSRSTIVGARTGSSYRQYIGVTAIGAELSAASINNTTVGYGSLGSRLDANNNTSLGTGSGLSIRDGSNNISIGYGSDVPSTTDSFQLSIGNLIYGTRMDGIENTVSNGKIGINTKTPAYELDVNGKLGVRSMDSISAAPNVLWHDPTTGEIRKAAIAKKQTFAQTATATVTGTTAETTLIAAGAGSLTIPAAAWFAGKSFRVVVRGVYSSNSTNPTNLVFKIKLGATVIAQTSGIFIGSNKTNLPYEVRGEISCRSTGASGSVFSRGLVITNDATVARLDNGTSPTAVDLSAAKTLDVTVTMNSTAANNTVSSYIVTFEAVN